MEETIKNCTEFLHNLVADRISWGGKAIRSVRWPSICIQLSSNHVRTDRKPLKTPQNWTIRSKFPLIICRNTARPTASSLHNFPVPKPSRSQHSWVWAQCTTAPFSFRCSSIEPIKSECGHGHITDTMVGPAAPAARPPGCQQKVRHWYGQRHHSQAELQLHRKLLGPVREHLAAKENRGTKNKRQWLKGTAMWFRFPKSDVACVAPCW